jgi:hypothetical protein
MFERSHVQIRVRWPELQGPELVTAHRILADTIQRLLHGVIESRTGRILPHNAVHHTFKNVAADDRAQAEAQVVGAKAHRHLTNVNIELVQQKVDTENGGAVNETEIGTPEFDVVARQPPLHDKNVRVRAIHRYPDWSMVHRRTCEGIHKRIAQSDVRQT